jgi:hypothetical protein
MKATLQTVLIGVLALAALWIYLPHLGSGAEEPGVPDADSESSEANVIHVSEARTELSARQLSGGLPADPGVWRGKPVLADLDGDGDLDLVASVRKWLEEITGFRENGLFVWLGDGKGNWDLSIEGLPRDMGYGGSAVLDVNGDGHLDIAFSGHDIWPKVFLGDGKGKWTESSEGLFNEGTTIDVALGDLDGDGDAELASLAFFAKGGGVKVFELNELGNWNMLAELMPEDVYGSQVKILDIDGPDGDGLPEVIATTELGPKVWSLRDGEFVDRSAGLPQPDLGGTDMGLDALDLDGDGLAELLVSGAFYEGHLPVRLFRWDGEAWTQWGTGFAEDEAFFDAEFAELDGREGPEVVLGGKWGIRVYTMKEPGVFEELGRVEETHGVMHVTAGDVDKDGVDEIVYCGHHGIQVLDLGEELL